jgi:hypothetical protein
MVLPGGEPIQGTGIRPDVELGAIEGADRGGERRSLMDLIAGAKA